MKEYIVISIPSDDPVTPGDTCFSWDGLQHICGGTKCKYKGCKKSIHAIASKTDVPSLGDTVILTTKENFGQKLTVGAVGKNMTLWGKLSSPGMNRFYPGMYLHPLAIVSEKATWITESTQLTEKDVNFISLKMHGAKWREGIIAYLDTGEKMKVSRNIMPGMYEVELLEPYRTYPYYQAGAFIVAIENRTDVNLPLARIKCPTCGVFH